MRTLKSKDEILFHPVWNSMDPVWAECAKNFWAEQQVIPDSHTRELRARELILLVTDSAQNVIATSTGVKTKISRLNNKYLYEYRCFIAPDYRTIGFDCHLTLQSLQILEQAARSESDGAIGVFVVVQNNRLNTMQINNRAVWRAFKMYLLGYNEDGFPIRVYYFNGARI